MGNMGCQSGFGTYSANTIYLIMLKLTDSKLSSPSSFFGEYASKSEVFFKCYYCFFALNHGANSIIIEQAVSRCGKFSK